jgi:hypothetical protein
MKSEQEKRIQRIVKSAQEQDEYTLFETWHTYLQKHLKVPFRAVVEEYQRGPVGQDDQVTVMGITSMDDTYGTIVAVKHKRGVHELPVRDLKALDVDTQTEQLVDDYGMWFANR